MKKYGLVSLGIVGFLLVIFGLLYQFAGLKYYIKARILVNKYQSEDKQWMKDMVVSDPKGKIYSGTYAGSLGGKYPGIFIWTNSGLKFFFVDSKSIYTFTEGCTEEILNPSPENAGNSFSMEKHIYFELPHFTNWLDQSTLVSVTAVNGSVFKQVSEARGMDWWPFIKGDMKAQCEK